LIQINYQEGVKQKSGQVKAWPLKRFTARFYQA